MNRSGSSEVRVSIAMPNEGDLDIMNEAVEKCKYFGVSYEVMVTSAHRSPDEMVRYARGLQARGVQIVIAAASGAAHLLGMIAAFTTVPVIAVPLRSELLDGLDSVFSMLHMPPGIPVATSSVNGAGNAAIFACQIIGLHDENVRQKVEIFRNVLRDEVLKQADNVRKKTVRS